MKQSRETAGPVYRPSGRPGAQKALVRKRTSVASFSPCLPCSQLPVGEKVLNPPEAAVDLLRNTLRQQALFLKRFSELGTHLLNSAELYTVSDNVEVFRSGDSSEYLYCIYSGKIILSGESQEELLPGAVYGLADLYQESAHQLSGTSSEELVYWAWSKPNCLKCLKLANSQHRKRLRVFLQASPLFKLLSTSQLDFAIDSLEEVFYARGDTILVEGQVSTSLYFVWDGKVKCYKRHKDLGILKEGEYFGEKSLLFGIPRTAAAVAECNTVLLEFSKQALQAIVGDNLASWLYRERLNVALLNSEHLTYFLPEKLQLLADALEIQQYDACRTVVNRHTKKGTGVWVVLKGQLTTRSGQTFEEGTLFGESELVKGEEGLFASTVKTTVDTELGFLSKTALERIADKPLPQALETLRVVAALKNNRTTSDLNYADLEEISSHASLRRYQPGDWLFEEGEYSDELFIVREGKVQLIQKQEVLRSLKALSSVGYRSVVLGIPHSVSAVASMPTVCWVIHKQFLAALSTESTQKFLRKRLQYHDECVTLDDLRLMTVLHSSQGASAMIVADVHKPQPFLLKAVTHRLIEQSGLRQKVAAEREILRQLDHPMTVSLVKSWTDEDRTYFLMEHIQGLDLFSVMQELQPIPEDTARFYTAGLVLALAHLHDKSIVFRDLKPENIIIDTKGYPKLQNFRTAKIIRGRTATILGTPQFMAPEVITGKSYGITADLWSLGVVLFEMLTNRLPFGNAGSDPFQIYNCIVEGPVQVPDHLSSGVQALLTQLLSVQPIRRGSCAELKTHPWLRVVDWNSLLLRVGRGPYYISKRITQQEVQAASAQATTVRDIISKLENNTEHAKGVKRVNLSPSAWESIF